MDHAGILTRRPKPGHTARSAEKKPPFRSGLRKDDRCCAASAFNTGDKWSTPSSLYILKVRKLSGDSILRGACRSAPWEKLSS